MIDNLTIERVRDYITYEFAADYLGVRTRDIEWFVAMTNFPTKPYHMIHSSILVRWPR